MTDISKLKLTNTNHFSEQFVKASIALLVVGLIYWVHVFVWAPNHDAAPYLIEAQRLLDGGLFYRDILETNPPLIVFLYLPVVLLANLTGISGWAVFTALIGTITLAASYVIDYQVARVLPNVPWWLRWLVILLVIVVLPGYHSGQREHLSICLALPALCKWLVDDILGSEYQSKSTVIIYWLIASLGFLIKPFFLVVPAVFFVWRACQQREWRVLFCLEAMTLTLVSLVYVAVVWLYFQDWIENMQITWQVYFGFNQDMKVVILHAFKRQIIIFALVSTVLYFMPLTHACKRLVIGFIFASGVWLLLAVLQSKGWDYQILPTNLLIALSLSLALADLLYKPRPNKPALSSYVPQWIWVSLSIAVFSIVSYVSGKDRPLLVDVLRVPLYQSIANYSQEKPWVIWSTSLSDAFPLAVILPGPWASRSMHQFIVPGTLMLKQRGKAEAEQAERLQAVSAHFATEDLKRWQPQVVAIRTANNQSVEDSNFNFINFFSIDSEFSDEWTHYRLQEKLPGWEVYVRNL